jgi:hypothetical protein
MRYLTKSRYKLGLECPTKLYYTNKNKEYANIKLDDPFLQALADGGFQVEALARLEYPEGQLIQAEHYEYQKAIDETNSLLLQENCVIFEAAFGFDNLFIRTDILVKTGDKIELIEVKAKSFDPSDPHTFVGKKGALVPSWKPYLFDVAFQRYVIQNSFPQFQVKSYLKMADKTKTAKVDGLNQLFRISKNGDKRKDTNQLVNHIDDIGGSSVLSRINIDEIIDKIATNHYKYSTDFELDFEEGIHFLAKNYVADSKINFPLSFSTCKKCEFKHDSNNPHLKSGFEECFKTQLNWSQAEFNKPNLMEVWDFKSGGKLFNENQVLLMEDLNQDLYPIKEEAGKISRTERQWLQIEKQVENDDSIFVLKKELKEEMQTWEYPLHFIDFETSAVALPFNKGLKPYEQVAFQFSHHIAHENGKIEHANEFILNTAGVFPNFEFVRALKKALGDTGTIFRYSNHENSILNAIYVQLKESEESDKAQLIEFIQSITHSKNDSVEFWQGPRDMVDLCAVYKKYYFDPHTKGSNSIKAVLPALLRRSDFLQKKYIQSIGAIGISSKNFDENHSWLTIKNGVVQSPYKMLPPVFEAWSNDELDELLSDVEDLNNGGAALTAYGFLQYTDMTEIEREKISQALLRYCELDTLAMVMIWEHFGEVVDIN